MPFVSPLSHHGRFCHLVIDCERNIRLGVAVQPGLWPYVFELGWHGDIFRFSADNWRDEQSAQGHICWKVRRIDRPDTFPAGWEEVYAVIEEALAAYQAGHSPKKEVKSFTVEFPSCEAWEHTEPQPELIKILEMMGTKYVPGPKPTGPGPRHGHLSSLDRDNEEAGLISDLYRKHNQPEPLSRNEELALLRYAAGCGDQQAIAALEKGNPTSYMRLETNEELVARLSAEAEQGSAEAQYKLADIYRYQWTVPKNFELALKWAVTAAMHGHPQASKLIAEIYSKEVTELEDYKAWYKSALEDVDKGSFHNASYLATYYAEGKGVAQDMKEAFFWAGINYLMSYSHTSPAAMTAKKKMNEVQQSLTVEETAAAFDRMMPWIARQIDRPGLSIENNEIAKRALKHLEEIRAFGQLAN